MRDHTVIAEQPLAWHRDMDLTSLATHFQTLRAAPPDLAAAFAQAFEFVEQGGDADAARSDRLRQAGLALASAIETAPGKTATLPAHNLHHFAEAVLAMGLLCAKARDLGLISTDAAALGVVAMVGHDIDHDGVSLQPGVLEAHAAAASARICAPMLRAEDCALLEYVIEGTSVALVAENAARAAGTLPASGHGRHADWLRALANEADVTASLLPGGGIDFGDALAEELRLANHPAAGSIASFTGRLGFLRHYASFTPAATALGIAAIVQAQLDGLADIARAAGRGHTPEDGAAELDRLDRRTARARYQAAATAAMARPSGLPDPGLNQPRQVQPGKPGRRFQISLTVTILTAFSVIFIAVMGFTVFATYRVALQAAVTTAERAMANLTALTTARTAALVAPLYATIATAAALPDVTGTDGATLSATETWFRGLLTELPQVRAVAAVRPDGARVQMFALGAMAPAHREALAPPPLAALAIRAQPAFSGGNSGQGPPVWWRFVDAAGRVIAQRQGMADGDPRDELEYRTARSGPGVITTVLYVFPVLGVPGISLVRQMPDGGVLGIDIALDQMSGFLAAQRISPRSEALIMDDNGILIAASNPALMMASDRSGQAISWMAIVSSRDPLLREIWLQFATGALAPGRDITLSAAGEDFKVRMQALDDLGSPPSLVVVAVPTRDFTGPVDQLRDHMVLLLLAAGAIGLALISFVAGKITRPLADLTIEAEAIRRFELDRPLTVASHIVEVARLTTTMEAMKSALRTFGIYVPKDLVRQLVSGNLPARLGGERREVTVMFTDVVGFTTIADGLEAEQLMRLTSEYFERMTREVMGSFGTIDKFIGDAIMALWNAPGHDGLHAPHACLAALRCQALSRRMAEEFVTRGWPALHTRLGLNTGEAVIGNVGSSDRMSYTAISATVNLASRLEGLNKHYGTRILVGEATRAAAGPEFVFRHVDRVLAKGRRRPTDIHELLGLRGAAASRDDELVLTPVDIAWAETWDRIVAAYLDQRFAEARSLLQATEAGRDDALAGVYARRLDACIAAPPPADWDGVSVFT